jgi:hypothetical protein
MYHPPAVALQAAVAPWAAASISRQRLATNRDAASEIAPKLSPIKLRQIPAEGSALQVDGEERCSLIDPVSNISETSRRQIFDADVRKIRTIASGPKPLSRISSAVLWYPVALAARLAPAEKNEGIAQPYHGGSVER